MKHMPYAAESMADFMVSVGFIEEKPDLSNLFDSSFVKRSRRLMSASAPPPSLRKSPVFSPFSLLGRRPQEL